jgi:excisionase family DNA binding protein
LDKPVLTVSEVAEYLNLSDKTVLKMIRNKEIPCARVGNQWRFVRQMLDDWLLEKMDFGPGNGLSRMISEDNDLFQLSRLTRESLIRTDLTPGDGEHVLSQLIQPILNEGIVSDGEGLLQGLLEREKMVSTALGLGVAVPHTRRPDRNLSESPVISIGLCPTGVPFGAPDKQPTFLFFLVLSDTEVVHLRLMSRVGQLLRNRETREALISMKSPHDVMQYLIQRENLLFPAPLTGSSTK